MFIIDFDDTLFDTHKYKNVSFGPLEKFGISQDFAQEVYLKIRENNEPYSNEVLARTLAKYGYPETEILNELKKVTAGVIKGLVFDESIDFLQWLKSVGKKVILLTGGYPVFQQWKVESSGLAELFDGIFYVDKDKMKGLQDVFKKYSSEKSKWFINDKIDESKEVAKIFPDLNIILKKPKHKNTEEYLNSGLPYFETLTEIKNYIYESIGL